MMLFVFKKFECDGCVLLVTFPELKNVRWVLPDSYLDVKNKDYGGKEPFSFVPLYVIQIYIVVNACFSALSN